MIVIIQTAVRPHSQKEDNPRSPVRGRSFDLLDFLKQRHDQERCTLREMGYDFKVSLFQRPERHFSSFYFFDEAIDTKMHPWQLCCPPPERRYIRVEMFG